MTEKASQNNITFLPCNTFDIPYNDNVNVRYIIYKESRIKYRN